MNDTAGALGKIRNAHKDLHRTVGDSSIFHSWVAAPALARALCDSQQAHTVDEYFVTGFGYWRVPIGVRAQFESASRKVLAKLDPSWQQFAPLLRAGLAAATRASDVEVLQLLAIAAQPTKWRAGCWVPAGSFPLDNSGRTQGHLPEWNEFLTRMAGLTQNASDKPDESLIRMQWEAYRIKTIDLAVQEVANFNAVLSIALEARDLPSHGNRDEKRSRLLDSLFKHPAYRCETRDWKM